ncbi:Retrovirus-related Pol polyprotein from transposon RE1 [Linum perenne]
MTQNFEMSMMGELTYFLGLQVNQKSSGILIHQSIYVHSMLEKFGLANSNSCHTPMATSLKLDKDEQGTAVDPKLYRGMIGSLLYLAASRPDIQYSVCLCARFQSSPKESHLSVVKRIFRYLKGTTSMGLWYPRNDSFDLLAYSDSDYAGSIVDRKTTTGACQFLGDKLISWASKKQSSVALSIAEAEYIAAGQCCTQILWIKSQLSDYLIHLSTMPVLCDNTSAISISKNPVQHSRTKHIEVRFHFIRELVQDQVVSLSFISINDQLADLFTKPLMEDRFCEIRTNLGMVSESDLPNH